MLNNDNGQNPTNPGNNINPATSPIADQEMLTDILDLEGGSTEQSNLNAIPQSAQMPEMAAVPSSAQAQATEPVTASVAPVNSVNQSQPATNIGAGSAGPVMPEINSNEEVVDMFDAVPSLSTEAPQAAAPQFSNNQVPQRPKKKSSIIGILLIVIIIIALIGAVLAAYNFWQNSLSEDDNLEESMLETETDLNDENITELTDSYDYVLEDDYMEEEDIVLPGIADVPVEEDFGMGLDEELLDVDLAELEEDIVLPPLTSDEETSEVLDYEEENIEEDMIMEDSEEDNELILDFDLDDDGLTNAEEDTFGTDQTLADTDGDGLSDQEEIMLYETDPLNQDTDGDGYLDGEEVEAGYDPNGPGKLSE